jgi:hypothetical protein
MGILNELRAEILCAYPLKILSWLIIIPVGIDIVKLPRDPEEGIE